MYREYFGLKENPFTIAPDPHFFFMSEGHREALAHLLYGVNSDSGFVLLTGEVGTGKTLLCRCLISQIPKNTEIAFILNPKLNVNELLASICDEFGVPYPEGRPSNKVLVAAIYDFLLQTHREGGRAILIIEEAQNLSEDVLEQIRLLTNLETNQRKLLQIILLGQPELLALLKRPQLRQLLQRITARYHLGSLSRDEVSLYVAHRLSVAGLGRGRLFSDAAFGLLYRYSGGIPRLVNMICDRALVGAFAQNRDEVDARTLKTAAREVTGEDLTHWPRRYWRYGAAAAVLIVIASLAWFLLSLGVKPESPPLAETPPLAVVETPTVKAVTIPNIQSALPEVSQDDSLSLPADFDSTALQNEAYRALFSAWNLRFNPEDAAPARQQARKDGVRLMRGKGSVVNLRLLNRPVVLTLTHPQTRKPFYVALTSLTADRAQVMLDGHPKSVSVQELSLLWTGDYEFIWQPPPSYSREMNPGYRGPLVDWLRQHLAAATGSSVTTATDSAYRGALVDAVKDFQLSANLAPDGIAGPMTLAYISGAAGGDGPLLDAKP